MLKTLVILLAVLLVSFVLFKTSPFSSPLQLTKSDTCVADHRRVMLVETSGNFKSGQFLSFEIPAGVTGVTIHKQG